ncbi:MAG: hypothetical protein ABW110_17820 [Steroidobacteraceae bacterium]
MVEVIEALSGNVGIYNSILAGEKPGTIRFHHCGYAVPSLEALNVARTRHLEKGNSIVCEGAAHGIPWFYADTFRALGHLQEYAYFPPERAAFLNEIPRN